jgi:hypothetical protein
MINICASQFDLPELPGMTGKLEDCGICIARPEMPSDAMLCKTGDIRGDLPAIAICKGDSSDLYPHVATRLKMPCIIGAVKSYSQTAWNLPAVDMRHYLIHLPHSDIWPDPEPNPPPCRPLLPWLEYIHLPQMAPFARVASEYQNYQTVDMAERDIRASFDGTIDYAAGEFAGEAISRHRERLAPLASPFRLGQREYIARLCQSRAVVSPWGYGEACWRDWEAILCGASVVKPASPWVACGSGYFQSEHVTWCKPDWSDLSNAIDMAASRTTAQRLAAIEWALDERAKAADIVVASLSAIIKESGL